MDFIKKLVGVAPVPEENGQGLEPSPLSKFLAVEKKTNYKPDDFDGKKYTGDKKILVICTEERYMTMENGQKFSTGNHPVETMVPMMHMENAGFAIEIATPTGKPAAMEMWALPSKDEAVMKYFNDKKAVLEKPKSLQDICSREASLKEYAAFFAPGGHGAMLGLPEDDNMGKIISYCKEKDVYLVSVCHGPAVFLAAKSTPHPYDGYKIAAFPDSVDKQTPMIGYLPGGMPWYFGERLTEKCGFTIVNSKADDTVTVDRKLVTGASPKACQKLGTTIAEKLLEEFA